MAIYKYKAISERGQVLEGYQEDQSEAEVITILKSNNYYPIVIEEDRGSHVREELISKRITKKIWRYFAGNFILC